MCNQWTQLLASACDLFEPAGIKACLVVAMNVESYVFPVSGKYIVQFTDASLPIRGSSLQKRESPVMQPNLLGKILANLSSDCALS
jgi:hypothetical protein